MGCESCYCNSLMQKRKGCLYMFEEAYNRLNYFCPCLECVVQIMCRDRYNICEKFHNFLNNGQVVITDEAKVFNCKT